MRLIKYRFNDEVLLVQALKHRSYLVITGEERLESNERLELLGDAVLGMVITEYVYRTYPDREEGVLTNYKSLLVNRSNLSRVAREVKLGDFLFLNESEERAGGRERDSILSDAFEALIGAIYLDGGLEPVRKLIQKHIATNLKMLLGETQLKNYKSMLLEFCQKENIQGPVYIVEDEIGPDHCKTFTVGVLIDGYKRGVGVGQSKKLAEQKAAEEALTYLHMEYKEGMQA
ncbi:ribonuclease III [candidate division KSB1 bacterium]|nr:ribonuclease III [candidate division KSB1 bacterium]